MQEFAEKNYEGARNCANNIKKDADEIMSIFDEVDATMKQLYGDNWKSTGAEDAHARYNELRKNYEVFYNDVVQMHTDIHTVTKANEEADAAASQTIAGVDTKI